MTIAKAKAEVTYWTKRLANAPKAYRRFDKATRILLEQSDRGGLLLAKETLAKLQARKCQIESVQCVKATWGQP